MRFVSVPASQNAAPLDVVVKPPMRFVTVDSRPDCAILRDAQKFALPAPAPMRPALGMYVAPICSASFNCAPDSPGLPDRSNAAAPLTIGVAMLVPLSLK